MGFRTEWAAASADALDRVQRVFANASASVRDSIVNGSAVTGAPALPVGQGEPGAGELRDGVQLAFPSSSSARISTSVPYAANVEDNVRGVRFHSGGPHGWKLTAAGWSRIVEVEAKKLGFSGGGNG